MTGKDAGEHNWSFDLADYGSSRTSDAEERREPPGAPARLAMLELSAEDTVGYGDDLTAGEETERRREGMVVERRTRCRGDRRRQNRRDQGDWVAGGGEKSVHGIYILDLFIGLMVKRGECGCLDEMTLRFQILSVVPFLS